MLLLGGTVLDALAYFCLMLGSTGTMGTGLVAFASCFGFKLAVGIALWLSAEIDAGGHCLEYLFVACHCRSRLLTCGKPQGMVK